MIHFRPPNFTRAHLRSVLYYDTDSGEWTRLSSKRGDHVGKRAGYTNKSDGRRYIKVKNKRYSESRLAWFYVKGTWPKRDVEHRDGDKTNNKWKNFRLATRTQNQGNAKPRVLLKGVTRVRTGKYTAQIQRNMCKMHLGTFDTAEEAHAAYAAAAKKVFGDFARAT